MYTSTLQLERVRSSVRTAALNLPALWYLLDGLAELILPRFVRQSESVVRLEFQRTHPPPRAPALFFDPRGVVEVKLVADRPWCTFG